jgi:hypothetical protein
MILRQLTLYLDPIEDAAYSYELLKKSRHILNYVERTCLRRINYETDGFKGIVIHKRYDDLTEPHITLNKSLDIPLPFDKAKYDAIETDDEFRNYVEVCVRKALAKIKNKYDVPADEILETIEILKRNNYVNEWTHKRKVDSKRGITAILNCSLTIKKFSLRLIISIAKEEVFNEVVLTTDPDEVAFHYRFKDIIIDDDKIIVTQKISKNLLEYSIKKNKVKMLD